MVSIQSYDENLSFKNWLRSGGIITYGVWLGGQVLNANSTVHWLNGDTSTYTKWQTGEPNELAVTCVHMGYRNTTEWYNYYCDNTNEIAIVCQRRLRFI